MIHKIIESAFRTGCLSVESEGLLRQMVTSRGCQADDLTALKHLQDAIHAGQVQREAKGAQFELAMLETAPE